MYQPRDKVLWFSILSRVGVVLLQFIFNCLCPDHEADAFRTPCSPVERVSIYDKAVDALLGGLTRWDSQYFIHIAKYGYTYENSLVFFPLYPAVVRFVAILLKYVLVSLNYHSVITIAAVFVNFVCFVKSALIFYDLSEKVLKRASLAYKAAILYCINPASIFFSAAYSESMFAYFTFYSMLASFENRRFVYLPISLSTIVRSNGLLNIGFPIFFLLQNHFVLEYSQFVCAYKNDSIRKALFSRAFRFLIVLIDIVNIIFLSVVPFVFYQIYIYIVFCTEYSQENLLPEHVTSFGVKNNFSLPGNDTLMWCRDSVPFSYSKVQAKYWNVGFLEYYRLEQLPNFLLATPVIYVISRCILRYFMEHKNILFHSRKSKAQHNSCLAKHTSLPTAAFVFIIHGLFLMLFCIFFVHIQVSTRLLASASPLLYWHCAIAMSYNNRVTTRSKETYEEYENASSKWRVFFMYQKQYTMKDISILSYFLGYIVLGCFMHANYLPWT